MTRQTPAPLTRLNLTTENRSAREMARMVDDGLTDINQPYQRGDVWSTDQRIALVRSWLSGIPVPAITINDRGTGAWQRANGSSPLNTGKGIYACVDGKQRLSTAVMWFGGDLAVPASWFDPEVVESTTETEDGPYVTIKDLAQSEQTHLGFTCALPATMAQVATVAEEADLYLLINGGGTPQTQDEMDNAARYSTGM